ncbi:MAG: hypothetical protein K9H25_16295 [Rhodospirillum sp.]|nr:hypothetical protein [Rhodospirillum sp.]MCF8489633.1 hypothetical protein [Rhodospirillum sp.]
MAEDTTTPPMAIPMANPPTASRPSAEPVSGTGTEELLRQLDATRFLLTRPQTGVR